MVDNHGAQRHSSKSKANSSTSSNVVGVHYRVGKKIGEGSFGVIYEGKHIYLSLNPSSGPYLTKELYLMSPPQHL
jgi:serine/threonine protein kinase